MSDITNKRDKIIEEVLKNSYEKTGPSDSWEALRERIDKRLQDRRSRKLSGGNLKDAIFWRRVALASAACFLITAGFLLYTILRNGREGQPEVNTYAGGKLFDSSQIEQLKAAFSQVHELFGEQSGWIIMGSAVNTQIGISDRVPAGPDADKLVVVRLAIDRGNAKRIKQYCDLVTFSDQRTNFRLTLDDNLFLNILLTPTVREDGRIAVNISTQVDDKPPVNGAGIVASDKYVSVAKIQRNGHLIQIDCIGQSLSNI